MLPEYQLFVTGSSSFELANHLNEPLTGRKWEHYMFPLSFAEMVQHHGYWWKNCWFRTGWFMDTTPKWLLNRETRKRFSDNMLISNLSQIENRNDTGALSENFIISERKKFLHYTDLWFNTWFWRTKQQNEIDYLEERNGKLTAFDFKWSPDAKFRQPVAFATYADAEFKVIHKDNMENFLL